MGSNLMWAIKNGDLSQVKMYVEKENCDVNADLLNGRMALHYAADYGQVEVAKYLISKGANVNQVDRYGISALLAAIWENHAECVKLLLQHGADKNGKTPDGKSYYDAAESQNIRELLL